MSMKIKSLDWRASVQDLSSLYEADPIEVMILLRHTFLSCAINLLRSGEPMDYQIGISACLSAEALQEAIEQFISIDKLNELEPAYKKEYSKVSPIEIH